MCVPAAKPGQYSLEGKVWCPAACCCGSSNVGQAPAVIQKLWHGTTSGPLPTLKDPTEHKSDAVSRKYRPGWIAMTPANRDADEFSAPPQHNGAAGGSPVDSGERSSFSSVIADHLHVVPGVSTRRGGAIRRLHCPGPGQPALCIPRAPAAFAGTRHLPTRSAVAFAQHTMSAVEHALSAAARRCMPAAGSRVFPTMQTRNKTDRSGEVFLRFLCSRLHGCFAVGCFGTRRP